MRAALARGPAAGAGAGERAAGARAARCGQRGGAAARGAGAALRRRAGAGAGRGAGPGGAADLADPPAAGDAGGAGIRRPDGDAGRGSRLRSACCWKRCAARCARPGAARGGWCCARIAWMARCRRSRSARGWPRATRAPGPAVPREAGTAGPGFGFDRITLEAPVTDPLAGAQDGLGTAAARRGGRSWRNCSTACRSACRCGASRRARRHWPERAVRRVGAFDEVAVPEAGPRSPGRCGCCAARPCDRRDGAAAGCAALAAADRARGASRAARRRAGALRAGMVARQAGPPAARLLPGGAGLGRAALGLPHRLGGAGEPAHWMLHGRLRGACGGCRHDGLRRTRRAVELLLPRRRVASAGDRGAGARRWAMPRSASRTATPSPALVRAHVGGGGGRAALRAGRAARAGGWRGIPRLADRPRRLGAAVAPALGRRGWQAPKGECRIDARGADRRTREGSVHGAASRPRRSDADFAERLRRAMRGAAPAAGPAAVLRRGASLSAATTGAAGCAGGDRRAAARRRRRALPCGRAAAARGCAGRDPAAARRSMRWAWPPSRMPRRI